MVFPFIELLQIEQLGIKLYMLNDIKGNSSFEYQWSNSGRAIWGVSLSPPMVITYWRLQYVQVLCPCFIVNSYERFLLEDNCPL